MDNTNTSGDVIAEKPEQVQAQEQQTEVQSTGSVTATEQTEVVANPEAEVIKTEERDDIWKNKYYESERKFSNLEKSLPKLIEETIIKTTTQQQQPQEREYTIAELEAYKMAHPEYTAWVEEQKASILEKRIAKQFQAQEEARQKQFQKAQSEQKVISNPRYAEAFTKTPDGQVLFNNNSQLAHLMSQYYNDPRLSGQTDALEIAAKLAYADYSERTSEKQTASLQSLQRQNAQLKQQTLVESGGVQNVVSKKDPIRDGIDNMSKPYIGSNKKVALDAIAAYMQKYHGV